MKTTLLAFAMAFAATGAFAESPDAAGPTAAQTASALSRADVVRQVLEARAAGTLLAAGELGQVPAPTVSLKTRKQVQAEFLQTDPHWVSASGYLPG